MWNARIAAVHRDGMKPVAAAVVERWFTREFRASSPEKVALVRPMLENTPPMGYSACCAAVRDMDQRDAIAATKSPTLVIYGAKDPVMPVSEALFLVDQIRGAKKLELDAAHLSNVERAAEFTEAVERFLLGC
jgi:3-oxoadipate enol-lactonase